MNWNYNQTEAGAEERETESFEILKDLVDLQDEYEILNGGGPNWTERFHKAMARARAFTFKDPTP